MESVRGNAEAETTQSVLLILDFFCQGGGGLQLMSPCTNSEWILHPMNDALPGLIKTVSLGKLQEREDGSQGPT